MSHWHWVTFGQQRKAATLASFWLVSPSLLLPCSHARHWQELNEGTTDATSRPSPKVGSWSMSGQRPTRPSQRLSSRNIQGLSAAKWTVISCIAEEYDINVIFLEETCVATGGISAFISPIIVEISMLSLFHIFCSNAPIAYPLNYVVDSPSSNFVF